MQFGSGRFAPAGWINFDASPFLIIQRLPLLGSILVRDAARFPSQVKYGDIRKGLLLPERSCKGIYASHVLEHMTLQDARTALKNTLAMLKPGGLFRVVVPDLEILARRYLDSTDPEASHVFLDKTLLGSRDRRVGVSFALRKFLGHSKHLWMWDRRSLELELIRIGFRSVRAAEFGDSEDGMFGQVEVNERFEDAVSMEARR